MPVTTVTVAYVNPPREGKKQGSIKSEAGEYYAVWPEKLSAFQPGQSYQIEYTESAQGFKSLKRIVDGMPARNGAAAVPSSGGRTNAEDMWVMAWVKAWEGTGGVPPEDELTRLVRMLLRAWRNGHKEAPAVPEEPLDDEIPF